MNGYPYYVPIKQSKYLIVSGADITGLDLYNLRKSGVSLTQN